MNLILFEAEELHGGLPLTDKRAQHVLKVLRRQVGDSFDVGRINGPRGKAVVTEIGDLELKLKFSWQENRAEQRGCHLIIGLPRPQTARDILRDATTMGASRIDFVTTERSDPNYATSSLWSSGEWRRHCLTGAEQAFSTRLPEVTWNLSLAEALSHQPRALVSGLAFDNYEAAEALSASTILKSDTIPDLVFGPERGFGDRDRMLLREAGFRFVHMGTRVLRLETAVLSALAVMRSTRGWV